MIFSFMCRFVDRCLSFCTFSFGHCFVCSSIYGFWLPLWYELGCSGRVSSSCSTSGTRRVNLVTNPEISPDWGEDLEVFMTSGTYLWSFVTQILSPAPSLQEKKNVQICKNILQVEPKLEIRVVRHCMTIL
jgi:hypothetical protein